MVMIDHYDYSFWQFILIVILFIFEALRFLKWLLNRQTGDEDDED